MARSIAEAICAAMEWKTTGELSSAEIVELVVPTKEVIIRDPFHPQRVRVDVRRGDGSTVQLSLRVPGVAVKIVDDTIAKVGSVGVVTGLRKGTTELRVSFKGHGVTVPVKVTFGPVVAFGTGPHG